MNRVVAAKEGLSVLIGLDERVQAAVKTFWSSRTKEELLLSCIEKSLQVFPDSAPTCNCGSLITAMRKHNKPIPGFRMFHCEDCDYGFFLKTRDCYSPSVETCPKCFADIAPYSRQEHPEWPVDKSGNLI